MDWDLFYRFKEEYTLRIVFSYARCSLSILRDRIPEVIHVNVEPILKSCTAVGM
jgi:hypothetical protein